MKTCAVKVLNHDSLGLGELDGAKSCEDLAATPKNVNKMKEDCLDSTSRYSNCTNISSYSIPFLSNFFKEWSTVK